MTPRVLFVGHSAALSGAELYLLGMLARTRAIAPSVLLFEDGPLRGRLEALGVPTSVCPMPGSLEAVARTGEGGGSTVAAVRGLPGFGARLRRALAESGADVVCTNSAKAHVVVAPLARACRLPVVVHLHDRVVPDTYAWPNRAALHAAVAVATAVVANSQETRSTLLPRERRRAHVVHCPVEVSPPVVAADRARPGRLSIALVGRISVWKGHRLAIEALHRAAVAARADGGAPVDLTLHVYGSALFPRDVEHGEQARRLADELGLADRVHWHGHVDDVTAAMRTHDLVLHASTQPEPYGQVIAEAMAAGVAVLAADRGGPLELVEHGRSGWLYAMGDTGALADALVRLARDVDLRERLAAGGHARAADLSYDVLLPRWEQVLVAAARGSRVS